MAKHMHSIGSCPRPRALTHQKGAATSGTAGDMYRFVRQRGAYNTHAPKPTRTRMPGVIHHHRRAALLGTPLLLLVLLQLPSRSGSAGA